MSIVKRLFASLFFAAFAMVCATAQAQLADRKALTLEAAKNIAAAAETEARRNNWNVVIAIVDEGGHLIYLQRMDGTQTGSIDVAIGKARTSAAFKRPTKVFDDLAGKRPSILTIDAAAVLLEGGIEIRVGNEVIGAIGVSGVTSQQDAQIAEAGRAALKR